MIDEPRGRIDYQEDGAGPTVVLVPGSCSTGAAWKPVIAAWNGGFRAVTTSLLGYGGTVERRTELDPDVSHEAEIVEAVIRRTAGPVHLVGHSFGGMVALVVALRNRVSLSSLTIVEAPALHLLRREGEEEHHRAFRQMTDSYFAAFRAGERTAIEAMIDFYGGAGTFASWPPRVRDYAIESTAVNILDWASALGFPLEPASLAKVEIPSLVIRGGASPPAMRRANELLSQCLPGASLATVQGAAHFMIATHAGEVAGAIEQHISAR